MKSNEIYIHDKILNIDKGSLKKNCDELPAALLLNQLIKQMLGGEIIYSKVKIKVLKASKSTYWYADLVGKIIEVEKQIWDESSVSYKSLEKEAAYFFIEDIEEVQE